MVWIIFFIIVGVSLFKCLLIKCLIVLCNDLFRWELVNSFLLRIVLNLLFFDILIIVVFIFLMKGLCIGFNVFWLLNIDSMLLNCEFLMILIKEL